jgi:hypothetical protein
MILNAISLRQPWANLVASGAKTLETRTWTTKHRGDLLVCVSTHGKQQPQGVALCLVTVVDCRPMVAEDAAAACIDVYPRANVWVLTNVRPVRQIPIKGRLKIYEVEVPDDILTLRPS